MLDENLTRRVRDLRVVLILGGDICRAEDPRYLDGLGWRSIRGLERDKTGPMPSYERVQAGAVLWQMNKELIFVPSGGMTNLPNEEGKSPAISTVMAKELRALGVPFQRIVEENDSYNSFEQLTNCARIVREREWDFLEIGILTVFFHFGRVAAMLGQADFWPLGPDNITFLSAERVLAADSKEWNEYFRSLYASPEMQVTLAGEAMGTGQLLTGHSPRFPHPFKGFDDPLR